MIKSLYITFTIFSLAFAMNASAQSDTAVSITKKINISDEPIGTYSPPEDPSKLRDSLTLETMDGYISLEEALKDPDNVIKLELRKQKLDKLPAEIFTFKNLQYLDLSKNRLTEIPGDIEKLQNLQVLILSKNDIESLPKEIGRLKNLRVLNVNQNELVALPPQIGNLENLRYLDLWSNNISYFPEQMKYLKNLRSMDLRVILINTPDQKKIQEMLPNTRIYFSPSCNCQY